MNIKDTRVHFPEKQHFPPAPFGSSSKGSDSGTGSLVIGEGAKRFFEPTYGAPEVYRSSCRIIEPVQRPSEPPMRRPRPGLQDLTFTTFSRDRDRRHVTEKDLPCVISPKDKELNWTTKKTVIYGDDNKPRHSFRSGEYVIESQINRKQRILETDSEKLRNYIPAASLGDKAYKSPEQSAGFFRDGGLIVGSSAAPRPSGPRAPAAPAASLARSIKSLSAHEKRELETTKNDMSAIETLTNSHYKRGQQQPSWEERTGMWLCRPEDEND